MRYYAKIFLFAFLCFSVMIGSGLYAFNRYYDPMAVADAGDETLFEEEPAEPQVEIEPEDPYENLTELERLIAESERINILLFGTDGGRADTIMLVSYDPENKLADVVSVPRDTYHKVPGYDLSGQYKINAVYGFRGDGGSEGMKKYLSAFLGVPIDYTVRVSYNGVGAIVDTLGGIEVNVPFAMNYDDTAADPPLHIHLEPGRQVLNGEQAMGYLRWRKNNGEAGQGDLPRIERQQEFVKLVAKKALSFKLPTVIKTGLNYVRTDLPLDQALYLGTKVVGFSFDNLEMHRLPGEAGNGGYYFHDPAETEELLKEIYRRSPAEDVEE